MVWLCTCGTAATGAIDIGVCNKFLCCWHLPFFLYDCVGDVFVLYCTVLYCTVCSTMKPRRTDTCIRRMAVMYAHIWAAIVYEDIMCLKMCWIPSLAKYSAYYTTQHVEQFVQRQMEYYMCVWMFICLIWTDKLNIFAMKEIAVKLSKWIHTIGAIIDGKCANAQHMVWQRRK